MTEHHTEIKPVTGLHLPKCPLIIFYEKSALLSDDENNGNRVLRLDVFAEKALSSAVISVVCLGEDGQTLREIKHNYQPQAPVHKQFGEYIFIDLGGSDVADVTIEVEQVTQGHMWFASHAKQTPKGQKLLAQKTLTSKQKAIVAIVVVLAIIGGGLIAFFTLRDTSEGPTSPQALFAQLNHAHRTETRTETQTDEDGNDVQVEVPVEVDTVGEIRARLVPYGDTQALAEEIAVQYSHVTMEFVRIVSTPNLYAQAQEILEYLNEYFAPYADTYDYAYGYVYAQDNESRVHEVQFAEINIIFGRQMVRELTTVVRIGQYWYWLP